MSTLRSTWIARLSAGLVALSLTSLTCCAADPVANTPQSTPPASSGPSRPPQDQSGPPTPIASPPSTRASKEASPPPKQTSGSSAVFQHFKVAVSKIERRSDAEVVVRIQVCVRSLPPDPQGNRTRISWDPWSVRAGDRTVDAELAGTKPKNLFPKSVTYAVGGCASGWIPFPVEGEVSEITYENGIGDMAVWDADRLAQQPTTSQSGGTDSQGSRRSTIGEGTFVVNEDILPGRYRAKAAAGSSCYWARLKDDSGEPDSIIANNITDGSAVVTVKSSDGAFETTGCTPWSRQ